MARPAKKLLKELFRLVHEEPGVCGKVEDGYICTRSPGHKGIHIATGMRNIRRIWLGETNKDSNPMIEHIGCAIVDELIRLPGSCREGGPGGHWSCVLPSGHKGPHIAVGSMLDALWYS